MEAAAFPIMWNILKIGWWNFNCKYFIHHDQIVSEKCLLWFTRNKYLPLSQTNNKLYFEQLQHIKIICWGFAKWSTMQFLYMKAFERKKPILVFLYCSKKSGWIISKYKIKSKCENLKKFVGAEVVYFLKLTGNMKITWTIV